MTQLPRQTVDNALDATLELSCVAVEAKEA